MKLSLLDLVCFMLVIAAFVSFVLFPLVLRSLFG